MASTQKHANHSAVRSERSDTSEAVKHTPGPWEQLVMANGTTMIFDADMSQVALVPSANKTGKANAHLVAAAPDLLAQLVLMVELFNGFQGMELQWAKDTIAKATGQSQGTEPVAHGNQDVQAQEPQP